MRNITNRERIAAVATGLTLLAVATLILSLRVRKKMVSDPAPGLSVSDRHLTRESGEVLTSTVAIEDSQKVHTARPASTAVCLSQHCDLYASDRR